MHSEQVALRRTRINALAAITHGNGLEIGPLDSPIALKAECHVRYVDVFDTRVLHELSEFNPHVETADIVDVDFALQDHQGRICSLPEVAAPEGPYDWVVASHVVEHAPDLIGWLAEIAEILAEEGRLVLIVPDRRYTFDTLRPPTTVGQILEAHSYGHKTPSERAVFDHFRSTVSASAADLWADQSNRDHPLIYPFEKAVQMRQVALESREYIDCHIWLFTPQTLIEQIVELGRLGLCDFIVHDILPTALNELEFYVVLQRVPRDLDAVQEEVFRSQGLQTLLEESRGDEGAAERDTEPHPENAPFSESELKLIHLKRRVMRPINQALGR
jgi:SAM-dependent methyltransferase